MVKIDQITKYLSYLKNKILKPYYGFNAVIGLSCGIDSFLALRMLIYFNIFKNINVYFIDIESENDKKYLNIAIDYFKQYNITINYINLTEQYINIKKSFKYLNHNLDVNIKSRLRNMYLYHIANLTKSVVINTLNYSEYYLGYFTKFTDGLGDVNLLNGLIKKDVIVFANFFNIPIEIINRKPTSGLNFNYYDENDFGFKYSDLDKYLLKNSKLNNDLILKINNIVKRNKHKIIMISKFLNKPFRKYRKHARNF